MLRGVGGGAYDKLFLLQIREEKRETAKERNIFALSSHK